LRSKDVFLKLSIKMTAPFGGLSVFWINKNVSKNSNLKIMVKF